MVFPGPGPAVTATASMSDGRTPAFAKAPSSTGTIASRCARLATSGCHAAEPGVLVHRRRHLVAEQLPAADDADASLVAAVSMPSTRESQSSSEQ